MTQDPDRAPTVSLRRECGLIRPSAGWWAWLVDPHVVVSVCAAIPVWLVLVTTVGDRMYLPATSVAWLSLLLVQPIAEEVVFRGVLQGQLLRISAAHRAGPFTLANLAATAGFVGMHLFSQPPAWALATVVPSLLFGHLRERFGSVLPSVFMHVVYNAGFGLVACWPRL